MKKKRIFIAFPMLLTLTTGVVACGTNSRYESKNKDESVNSKPSNPDTETGSENPQTPDSSTGDKIIPDKPNPGEGDTKNPSNPDISNPDDGVVKEPENKNDKDGETEGTITEPEVPSKPEQPNPDEGGSEVPSNPVEPQKPGDKDGESSGGTVTEPEVPSKPEQPNPDEGGSKVPSEPVEPQNPGNKDGQTDGQDNSGNNQQEYTISKNDINVTYDSANVKIQISNFNNFYTSDSQIKAKLSDDQVVTGNVTIEGDLIKVLFAFNNLLEGKKYDIREFTLIKNSQNTILKFDEEISFTTGIKPTTTDFEHKSNKEISNNVFYNSLQTANDYSENDLNLSSSFDNNNQFYNSYISVVNNNVSESKTIEEEPKATNMQEITFETSEVNNENITFTVPHSVSNINQIFVKSWNRVKPWSKWITVTQSGNKILLNTSDLNNDVKFVVTYVKNEENTYVVGLNGKNIFLNNSKLQNLSINSFEVVKEEKELFGRLILNWNSEQLEILKNKLFEITFKAKQKVYEEKTRQEESSDIFNRRTITVVTNKHEQIDDKNRVQDIKKVFVTFDQLQKFNLSGLQEKITYKLESVQILDPDMLVSLSDEIKYSSDKYFSYNVNWSSNIQLSDQLYNSTNNNVVSANSNLVSTKLDLTKKELFSNHSISKDKIPFSINNLSTLINYNYEVFNVKNLFKNRQEYNGARNEKEFVDYKILKNGSEYDLHWFKTRDYLAEQPFQINEDKTFATISKDISGIEGLNSISDEDVIFWITFELNPNPQKALHWTEFNDVSSRITIPVSYKNIKESKMIPNAEFIYNTTSENNKYQADIASKIKNLVQFDIELQGDKLIIKLRSKNKAVFNNTTWEHNSYQGRSIYITTADLFVNWIQQKSSSKKLLSYKQKDKLDELSLETSATAYNDTYELKTKTYKRDQPSENGTVKTITIEGHLVDQPLKEDVVKRLFEEDKSKGIEQGRKRVYSLSKKSDGSWNIFAKVNDDPNDYRFWTFANYHVWDTNRKDTSGLAKESINSSGNRVLTIKKGEIIAPTMISKNIEDKQQPIFYRPSNDQTKDPLGNIFEFDFSDSEDAITYELIVDFSNNVKNNFDSFNDNLGTKQVRNPENEQVSKYDDTKYRDQQMNRADLLMAIVDFRAIFKKFENKNLATDEFDGKHLDVRQQKAIQHILDFKKLKPLRVSKLSRYINTYNNMNLYVASLPKVPTNNHDGTIEASRYREYIFGVNSIKVDFTAPENTSKSYNAAVYSEIDNVDLFSGASGSAIYDHNGDFIGFIEQGTYATINNFIFSETQKYSYFGNDDTKYNPGTFNSINKQLAYLYPSKFKNLFDK
ncbi:hypothetical protein [Mycoplasma sp. OR1901]|uniref:hypothetical protein n=1 Tax=Mycoplasma sp. OR1901 TaxID=2742195 RepID=UPI0015834566|nr:hypothetical protein [Mycoplasma sp. OR1901]QKT05471.1 hypothetical protein HTZ87_02005 [Mycoplasma sp. OR1901]